MRDAPPVLHRFELPGRIPMLFGAGFFWLIGLSGVGRPIGLGLLAVITPICAVLVGRALSFVAVYADHLLIRNLVRLHRVERFEIVAFDWKQSVITYTGLVKLEDGSQLRMRAIDLGNGLSRKYADRARKRLDQLRQWLAE